MKLSRNIHILPTEHKSKIGTHKSKNLYFHQNVFTESNFEKNFYLYITSDEKIKKGDYIFETDTNKVNIADKDYYRNEFDFKIILTTNLDLIKDGVQDIDDDFLEWFVKNPSCEFVEVETFEVEDYVGFAGHTGYPTFHNEYKIIIPQEEPKQCCDSGIVDDFCINTLKCKHAIKISKQETLEEFIFKVPFDYNIKPKEVIDMCMKEQENIILTFRLGNFIDMINSLSDDTEKNRILKSVFNNREGELLLESYKSMKLHYEK